MYAELDAERSDSRRRRAHDVAVTIVPNTSSASGQRADHDTSVLHGHGHQDNQLPHIADPVARSGQELATTLQTTNQ